VTEPTWEIVAVDVLAAFIQRAVADTLRTVALWGPTDEAVLLRVASDVESEREGWWSCPVCEEATCDDGCPLAPIR
jgi:hypothetical protein